MRVGPLEVDLVDTDAAMRDGTVVTDPPRTRGRAPGRPNSASASSPERSWRSGSGCGCRGELAGWLAAGRWPHVPASAIAVASWLACPPTWATRPGLAGIGLGRLPGPALSMLCAAWCSCSVGRGSLGG